MPVILYFYRGLSSTSLSSPFLLRLLALFLESVLILLPLDKTVKALNESGHYLKRGSTYESMLSLLIVTNPVLFDIAVHMIDFQGLLFVGCVVWACFSLVKQTSTAPFVIMAMHCSLQNGLMLFVGFTALTVLKLVKKRGLSLVGVATAMF